MQGTGMSRDNVAGIDVAGAVVGEACLCRVPGSRTERRLACTLTEQYDPNGCEQDEKVEEETAVLHIE
jgi:hypothetical protein